MKNGNNFDCPEGGRRDLKGGASDPEGMKTWVPCYYCIVYIIFNSTTNLKTKQTIIV
jgi:hypothetical protein